MRSRVEGREKANIRYVLQQSRMLLAREAHLVAYVLSAKASVVVARVRYACAVSNVSF